MTVRVATEADLDAIVQVSSGARELLEELEPVFWRRHPEADHAQRGWFGLLLDDEAYHVLVNSSDAGDLDGFVIARAIDAPPVYDPGGRTCMVDDFVSPEPGVAESLVVAVRQWAVSKGCTQLVIVTPAADDNRKELFDRIGLHPTSEWWTGPI